MFSGKNSSNEGVSEALCLSFLGSSETTFFNRFVVKYEQVVPELLNVCQGKIGILELGLASEKGYNTVVASQLHSSK